jgi:hypothetical protein
MTENDKLPLEGFKEYFMTNLSFPEKCHKLGYVLGNIVIEDFIEKLKEENFQNGN